MVQFDDYIVKINASSMNYALNRIICTQVRMFPPYHANLIMPICFKKILIS